MHDKTHSTFIPPEDQNTKIWRYMDYPKFVSLIDKKSLFFIKAIKFDDPYEGTIPKYNDVARREVYQEEKQKFKDEEQFEQFLRAALGVNKNIHDRWRKIILINSWHLNDYESAAMWDLYSRRNAGIAIQSTYGKLSQSLEKSYEDRVYIGKVKYIDYENEWMNEWNVYQAFVIKRKSFQHEQELRAITYLPESDSEAKRINPVELTDHGKYVKADIKVLIEKIYVAPKTSRYFHEGIKSIAEKFNIDKDLVIVSDLYSVK